MKRANGEGTTPRQRADGRWQANITLSSGERRSVYGKTQREVVKAVKELFKLDSSKLLVDTNRISTKDWIKQWLEGVKISKEITTFESYQYVLTSFIEPELGSIKLQQLTTSDIQAAVNIARVSTTTTRYIARVFKGCLKEAVKRKLIPQNPAENLVLPKPVKKEMTIITEEQLLKLFQANRQHRIYLALVLLFTTGLRRGELLALRWSDINFDRKVFTINRSLVNTANGPIEKTPKTDSSRATIELTDRLIDLLLEHREKQKKEEQRLNLVFPSKNGRHINPRNFHRLFSEWFKKAGLEPIRVHDSRHTFAALLIDKDINSKVIQELMRHDSIQTTLDQYGHLMKGRKLEALSQLNHLI